MPAGVHKNPHFAMRIPADLLAKFRYVAEYNARSANRELEILLKAHVAKFEKEHGAIPLEDCPAKKI